jgi:hypothetical protein
MNSSTTSLTHTRLSSWTAASTFAACDMAQDVNYRSFSTEARVQFQAGLCWIWGGKIDTETQLEEQ